MNDDTEIVPETCSSGISSASKSQALLWRENVSVMEMSSRTYSQRTALSAYLKALRDRLLIGKHFMFTCRIEVFNTTDIFNTTEDLRSSYILSYICC
jgi:hypothetical protein